MKDERESLHRMPEGYKFEKNQAEKMRGLTFTWRNVGTIPRSSGRKITFSSVPFKSRVQDIERKHSDSDKTCDE